MNITNCTVSDSGSDDSGGGIASNAGTMNITNTTISGNSTAGNGGGIFNTSGTVNITNSVISSNSAGGGGGGGIFNNSTMNIINSTLSDNSSTLGNGGGIRNKDNLNITNSTLSGNSATYGGRGGAIFNDVSRFSSVGISITNSTISGNSSDSYNGSGGITNFSGKVSVKNTIIALNTYSDTTGQDVYGTFTSQGYNLIGKSDGSTGFTNGMNNDQVGTNSAPVDPKLDPLGYYNGGATQTYRLQATSPAIDKGNSFGINTDQNSKPRPIILYPSNPRPGDGSDIGAFEVQTSPTAAPVSIGGRVMTTTGRGIGNVRVSLTDAQGNTQITVSNAFGYYHFANVEVGETYILNVSSKRYIFDNPTQVLSVTEEMSEVNFTALTRKGFNLGR